MVLLDIFTTGVSYYTQEAAREERFGFEQGMCSTHAMLVLGYITEKAKILKIELELWLMFRDYTKAFDAVYHCTTWESLLECGVPRLYLMFRDYTKAFDVVRHYTTWESLLECDVPRLYLMFRDYTKAFDVVRHCTTWESLLECDVPKHMVWLVRKINIKSTDFVRVGDEQSNTFVLERYQGRLSTITYVFQHRRRKNHASGRRRDA